MSELKKVFLKVILKSFDKDADRDSIVKMVQYFQKCNDDDASDFVDFLPNTLLEKCPEDKANGLVDLMQKYGAIIELESLEQDTPTDEPLEENDDQANSQDIEPEEEPKEASPISTKNDKPAKKKNSTPKVTASTFVAPKKVKERPPKKKWLTKKRITNTLLWVLGISLISILFQYSQTLVINSSPEVEEYTKQSMSLVNEHKQEMKKLGYKLRPDSALKHSKQGKKAYAIMKKATQKFPKKDEVWRTLGFIQKEMGLFEKANQSYSKATQLSPETPENHLALAGLLQEQELYGKAEFQLRKGLRHKPKDPNLLKGMAILHRYHLGDSTKALGWLFHYQLRSKDNGYDPDKMQLGRQALYLGLNKFGSKLDKAELNYAEFESERKNLESKIAQAPSDNNLQEKLADLYLAKGYKERAATQYNKILKNKPENISRLEEKVAKVYLKQDKPQAALTRLKRACLGNKKPSVTACRELFISEKYWKLNSDGAYKAWKQYIKMGGDEFQDLLRPELLELKLLE